MPGEVHGKSTMKLRVTGAGPVKLTSCWCPSYESCTHTHTHTPLVTFICHHPFQGLWLVVVAWWHGVGQLNPYIASGLDSNGLGGLVSKPFKSKREQWGS